MGKLFSSGGKHEPPRTRANNKRYNEPDYVEVGTAEAVRPVRIKRSRRGLVAAASILGVLVLVVAAGLLFYNSKLGMLNYDGTLEAENVSASVNEAIANLAQSEETTSSVIVAAEDETNAEHAAEASVAVKPEAAPALSPAVETQLLSAAAVPAAAEQERADSTDEKEEPEQVFAGDGLNPDDTLEVGDHEVKTGGSVKTAREAVTDNDIVNILVIGSDQRIPGTQDRGRADAVMLVSLNKNTGDIKLASFERAMGVPVEGQLDSKLNDTLNIGDAILIQNIISECFSVEIAGFVHLDYDSFPVIIDAIGGIDLTFDKLEASFFNGRITRDARSNFVATEGENHLPGYEALVYCRLRNADDNWTRQGRTRAVASAAVDKVKNLSLMELNSLANTILPLIHTNLTKGQISSILLSAPKFLSPEISQLMIPEKDSIWVYHGEGNEAMYGYDFDAETERLHEFIYGEVK